MEKAFLKQIVDSGSSVYRHRTKLSCYEKKTFDIRHRTYNTEYRYVISIIFLSCILTRSHTYRQRFKNSNIFKVPLTISNNSSAGDLLDLEII